MAITQYADWKSGRGCAVDDRPILAALLQGVVEKFALPANDMPHGEGSNHFSLLFKLNSRNSYALSNSGMF